MVDGAARSLNTETRIPAAVCEGIGRILVAGAELGWVCLALDSGVVVAADNCEKFGYSDVATAGIDDFPFLHGALPASGETIMIPMLQLPGGIPADTFIHHGADGLWLLFLGRETAHAEQGAMQQRMNEAMLTGEGYARLLDRFVGGELIKHRLLDSPLPTSMHPSTRHLTMLFADIRGFTPFCESRDAAEACQLLNRYLEIMVSAVTAHGGIIDKIIGDAVMALFGLTDAGDDAAARAISAAATMLEATRPLRDLTASGDLGVLGLGVGIASGQVAVGVLGSAARRSFTVIGHRVNLAARLESSADAGEVLLDEATYAAAGQHAGGFAEQTRTLKGLVRPVMVFSKHFN